ncbi:MAG: phage major capsid protein [Clostridium sp.]
MTIQELKQKRYGLYQEMRGIIDKADTEKRSMTGDENTKYERLDAEVDGLTSEIQKREKLQEQERHFAEKQEQQEKREFEDNKEGKTKNILETEEYRSAFKQYILEPGSITSEQRNLLMEKRALSSVTGASGGYTVPQGFYNQIQDAMKFYGGMRQAKTSIIPTTSGNDMPIPTANDTSIMGELLGENAQANSADVTFGQVILKAYKYSSKTILVPYELLQDSAFNIEQYIAKKLGERIGRITNQHFTTGDNASKPQGIITASALGKAGVVGQTTSVTYDDLVDLIHSVDIVYRANAEFMFHDLSLKALKKLKDGQQRPLWVPGLEVKEPDTIAGYKYVVNNDMPQMAASAKSIAFGDMSNYFIRDVMDIQLFRISDKYIESGQVGFLAFYRGDGRLVDAGMNPIKHYANSAT